MKINRQRVTELMAQRGIKTFTMLAQLSDIHYITVSRLMAGGPFRSQTVDAIAGTLGVQPTSIIVD